MENTKTNYKLGYQSIQNTLQLDNEAFRLFRNEIYQGFTSLGFAGRNLTDPDVKSRLDEYIDRQYDERVSQFSFSVPSTYLKRAIRNIIRQEHQMQQRRNKAGAARNESSSQSQSPSITTPPVREAIQHPSTSAQTQSPSISTTPARRATILPSTSAHTIPVRRAIELPSTPATLAVRVTSEGTQGQAPRKNTTPVIKPPSTGTQGQAPRKNTTPARPAIQHPSIVHPNAPSGQSITSKTRALSISQGSEEPDSLSIKNLRLTAEQIPSDQILIRTILTFTRPPDSHPSTRISLSDIIAYRGGMVPCLLSAESQFDKLVELLSTEMGFRINDEQLVSVEEVSVTIRSNTSLRAYIQKNILYTQVIEFKVIKISKRLRSATPPSETGSRPANKRSRLVGQGPNNNTDDSHQEPQSAGVDNANSTHPQENNSSTNTGDNNTDGSQSHMSDQHNNNKGQEQSANKDSSTEAPQTTATEVNDTSNTEAGPSSAEKGKGKLVEEDPIDANTETHLDIPDLEIAEDIDTNSDLAQNASEDEQEIGQDLTLEEQLDAIATNSIFERIELWYDCCNFFGVNSDRTSTEERFSIHGMRRPLMPHQLLCIYWMLVQERSDYCGGFLCDEQGFGKTTEMWGLILVNILLHDAQKKVSTSRTGNDGRHLPVGPQAENAQCPSRQENHIACPCVNSNKSASLLAARGPSLVFVPPGLLTNWINEFNTTIDNVLGIKLIVAHREHKSEQTILGNYNLLSPNSSGNAKSGSEKIIILTTSASFEGHVYRLTKISYQETVSVDRFNKNGKKLPKQGTKTVTIDKNSIRYARVIVDEFHNEKSITATIPKLLRETITTGCIWAASGTPFEAGPKDLLGYIKALEVRWSGNDEIIRRCGSEAASNIHKNVEAIRRKAAREDTIDNTLPNLTAQVTEKFGHILQMLMIRRTTESTWFNQPILDIPELNYNDITTPLDNRYVPMFTKLAEDAKAVLLRQYEANMVTWRENGCRGTEPKPSSRVWLSSARQARILATFPFLKRIVDTNAIDLTWVQFIDKGWFNCTSNPYIQYLTQIINSSQKMTNIKAILRSMNIEQSDEAPITDDDRKAIIFSEHPIVCYIIYEDLKRTYGNTVGFYWSNPKLKERQDLLQRFQHNDTETGGPLRILVGNIRMLGTGHTLTKADTVILVEPQWHVGQESQAIARVRRISQRANMCYAYRLYCPDVLVEKMIIQRQLFRKMIKDMSTTDNRAEEDRNIASTEAMTTDGGQSPIEIDL